MPQAALLTLLRSVRMGESTMPNGGCSGIQCQCRQCGCCQKRSMLAAARSRNFTTLRGSRGIHDCEGFGRWAMDVVQWVAGHHGRCCTVGNRVTAANPFGRNAQA